MINDIAADLLLDHAALIEERHNGTVSDGFINSIFVDQSAKGRERVLVLLEQRRSGESQITGMRQNSAHLHRELAVSAISAGLGAMALIDKDKNILAIVLKPQTPSLLYRTC